MADEKAALWACQRVGSWVVLLAVQWVELSVDLTVVGMVDMMAADWVVSSVELLDDG